MVGVGFIVIVLVAAVASLFMAWTIGAGSSGSTPFAPAVGANAISVMRAGLVVGILGFAGAVLQGASVAGAVGTGLIRGPVTLTALAAAVGLTVAAILVSIGIYTGYPIPTGFTATGAIIGVGLSLGGLPAWDKYTQIASLWILVPPVGGGIAYVLARLLRDERIPERRTIPILGGVIGAIFANMTFVFLGGESISTSVAASVSGFSLAGVGLVRVAITLAFALVVALVLRRDMAGDERSGQYHFLLVLGGLVAFSAGASQVGLAIGPLIPLLDRLPITLLALLVGGGLGLLIGSWTGAPRMIKALSQDYSSLGPRRSIAALIPSFAIAQIAVFFAIPISFNEIIVSAIIGSGFAGGASAVSRGKMGYTAFAWVVTLVLAIGLSYGAYAVIESIFL
ncbi:MAG TPA: anion permease [Halococcus sp.]|nr:anion permease [Halococcus sp.]